MSAKNKGKILKEAEKITSLIATARCLMSQNKSIDLSKLEQKVSSLCKKAEITDLKQSKEVQGILSTIVEDLNRLDNEITTLYNKLKQTSTEENTKRAINAYGLEENES